MLYRTIAIAMGWLGLGTHAAPLIAHTLTPPATEAASTLPNQWTASTQSPGVPSPQRIAQEKTPQTGSLADRLVGQWRSPEALSGQEDLTFLFTPQGQLFFIVRLPNGARAAQEFRYQLHPDTQPPGIDIIFPDGAIVPSILEFTPEGQLRLQLDGTEPSKPRPTQFQADADLFDKISDDAILPAEIVEREALLLLADFSRSQRTYYLEFRTFAPTVDRLYAQIPAQTENYTYTLVTQGDGTHSVMMTAIPKRPDLRSYTSAVFMVPGDRGFPISVPITCATTEPSTTPPPMPTPPATADGEIVCPSGSSLIEG